MSPVDSLALIAASTALFDRGGRYLNALAFLRRPCQASSIATDKIKGQRVRHVFPGDIGC